MISIIRKKKKKGKSYHIASENLTREGVGGEGVTIWVRLRAREQATKDFHLQGQQGGLLGLSIVSG